VDGGRPPTPFTGETDRKATDCCTSLLHRDERSLVPRSEQAFDLQFWEVFTFRPELRKRLLFWGLPTG